MTMRNMTAEEAARYGRALHAMQAGVAMEMNYDPGPTTPKHLRVGVNSALRDHAALVRVLFEKGGITAEDYYAALISEMEREVRWYEQRLKERYGADVKLV